MTLNQVSVFAENRFGTIKTVAEALAKENIDIRALSVADTEGFGVLRMIVSDVNKTTEILSKETCILSITPVLGVILPDKPGVLASILEILADAKINIDYMYAFIMKSAERAGVVIRVKESEKAERILRAAGIELMDENQVPFSV